MRRSLILHACEKTLLLHNRENNKSLKIVSQFLKNGSKDFEMLNNLFCESSSSVLPLRPIEVALVANAFTKARRLSPHFSNLVHHHIANNWSDASSYDTMMIIKFLAVCERNPDPKTVNLLITEILSNLSTQKPSTNEMRTICESLYHASKVLYPSKQACKMGEKYDEFDTLYDFYLEYASKSDISPIDLCYLVHSAHPALSNEQHSLLIHTILSRLHSLDINTTQNITWCISRRGWMNERFASKIFSVIERCTANRLYLKNPSHFTSLLRSCLETETWKNLTLSQKNFLHEVLMRFFQEMMSKSKNEKDSLTSRDVLTLLDCCQIMARKKRIVHCDVYRYVLWRTYDQCKAGEMRRGHTMDETLKLFLFLISNEDFLFEVTRNNKDESQALLAVLDSLVNRVDDLEIENALSLFSSTAFAARKLRQLAESAQCLPSGTNSYAKELRQGMRGLEREKEEIKDSEIVKSSFESSQLMESEFSVAWEKKLMLLINLMQEIFDGGKINISRIQKKFIIRALVACDREGIAVTSFFQFVDRNFVSLLSQFNTKDILDILRAISTLSIATPVMKSLVADHIYHNLPSYSEQEKRKIGEYLWDLSLDDPRLDELTQLAKKESSNEIITSTSCQEMIIELQVTEDK